MNLCVFQTDKPRREHRLDVTSVEAVVNPFKEVHFVRHSNLPSPWPALAQIHVPEPADGDTWGNWTFRKRDLTLQYRNADHISEDADYEGVRVTFVAYLARAKVPIQRRALRFLNGRKPRRARIMSYSELRMTLLVSSVDNS